MKRKTIGYTIVFDAIPPIPQRLSVENGKDVLINGAACDIFRTRAQVNRLIKNSCEVDDLEEWDFTVLRITEIDW